MFRDHCIGGVLVSESVSECGVQEGCGAGGMVVAVIVSGVLVWVRAGGAGGWGGCVGIGSVLL